jgi:hypothetical protein
MIKIISINLNNIIKIKEKSINKQNKIIQKKTQ